MVAGEAVTGLEVLAEETLLSVVVTNLADSPTAALVRDSGGRVDFLLVPQIFDFFRGSILGVGFRRYPAAFRPKNHTGERDSSTKGSTKSLGMLAQTFGKPDGAPRSQNALG